MSDPGRWLSVEVYRSAAIAADCTNGGVSGREPWLYVPHHRGNEENPPEALRLVPRSKGGVGNFVPAPIVERGEWSSAGGNFVWSCDSRFREMYGDRPVAVHDHVQRSGQ